MQPLRRLPQVDALARNPALDRFPLRLRVRAAKRAIDECRAAIRRGNELDPVSLAVSIAEREVRGSMVSVLNMSGVILHTGLGRAKMPPFVVEHVARVTSRHSIVEFNLEDGERGDRQDHVRSALIELTGAEDAMVVNNAAAAVVLSLAATSLGREVLLSRGEMVEIGGSFRMPDIVRQSGCRLVEVGCTNKTRISDYQEAITGETGAILRCHRSNFALIGFTEQPTSLQLRDLARQSKIPFIDDQGTGCLLDLSRYGIEGQMSLPESAAFSDLSIASGDKLLGGPQAGILVGRSEVIRLVKRHPLARAFRVDKLTLAALEATLALYLQAREMEIPTVYALLSPAWEVKERAEEIAAWWPGSVVAEGRTEIGAGAAPGTSVPTYRVGLPTSDRWSESELARTLRCGSIPVVGRIERGRVWLDPRTLEAAEMPLLREAIDEAKGSLAA